jgi:hypothetical protein
MKLSQELLYLAMKQVNGKVAYGDLGLETNLSSGDKY